MLRVADMRQQPARLFLRVVSHNSQEGACCACTAMRLCPELVMMETAAQRSRR